jgi:hypothetical protein
MYKVVSSNNAHGEKLRKQQLRLGILKASRVLLGQQEVLRQVLSQRIPRSLMPPQEQTDKVEITSSSSLAKTGLSGDGCVAATISCCSIVLSGFIERIMHGIFSCILYTFVSRLCGSCRKLN